MIFFDLIPSMDMLKCNDQPCLFGKKSYYMSIGSDNSFWPYYPILDSEAGPYAHWPYFYESGQLSNESIPRVR